MKGTKHQTPPKTATTLVFPLDAASKSYQTDSYSPDQTDNKAPSKEINAFISQIESEYKLHKKKHMRALSILGFWLLLQIFGTIFLRIRFRYLFQKTELAVLQIILLLIGRLILKRRSYSVPQLRNKCQDLVDEQNEAMRNRDLRWRLPDQFPSLIELCKDYKREKDVGEGARQEEDAEESTRINHDKLSMEAQKYLIRHQTGLTIVFPFEGHRFLKDFYSPGLTEKRVSHKEIQQVLSKMNVEYRNYYEKIEDFISSSLLFIGIQLFSLWYACNHFSTLFTLTEIILAGIFLNLINLQVFRTKLANMDIQLRKDCQKIIDEQNEALEGRNVRWNLPNEFPGWIELCKSNKAPISDSQSSIELASNSTNSESVNQDLEEQSDRNYQKKSENKKYAPLATDENESRDEE